MLALNDLEERGQSWDDFVFSLSDARRVYSCLRDQRSWEVVWTGNCASRKIPAESGEFLGYEPTLFNGDHFSAVSDSMCFPQWHGPGDDEGVLFLDYYRRLNKHALFDTIEDAQEFLKFYRSQDWTEKGEYVVAEVRLMGP